MHSRSLILAGLISTAAAVTRVAPAQIAARHELQARQTDSSDWIDEIPGLDDLNNAGECVEAMAAIASSMPTPPPELYSWAVTQTETNPCKVTNYPAEIEEAFEDYASTMTSWWSAYSKEHSDAMSKCPQIASIYDESQNYICTKDGSQTTPASAQVTSGSGSDSGSGSSGSSSKDDDQDAGTGAGHRETATVGLAVVLAGFLAAVAAL